MKKNEKLPNRYESAAKQFKPKRKFFYVNNTDKLYPKSSTHTRRIFGFVKISDADDIG